MSQTRPEQNKAVILKVVTTAVNPRDFASLDNYVHPDCAQHNPLIPGGATGCGAFVPRPA